MSNSSILSNFTIVWHLRKFFPHSGAFCLSFRPNKYIKNVSFLMKHLHCWLFFKYVETLWTPFLGTLLSPNQSMESMKLLCTRYKHKSPSTQKCVCLKLHSDVWASLCIMMIHCRHSEHSSAAGWKFLCVHFKSLFKTWTSRILWKCHVESCHLQCTHTHTERLWSIFDLKHGQGVKISTDT